MRPDSPDFLRERRQRSRVSTALLLSLLLHALLLSLSLGGAGVGLPGLDLPWRERRLHADDLRVTLVPRPARPADLALVEAPPTPLQEPLARVDPVVVPTTEPAPVALPVPAPTTAPTAAPTAAPTLMSSARADAASWAVPIVPVASAPVLMTAAAAASAAGPESLLAVPRDLAEAAQKQIALVAAQEAKLAKDRQAEEERAAASARLEALRQQEAARVLAAERQEAARQEAASQETARQEAIRQEAAKQETAKQDAANLAKAALAAARAEQDAKREAARRAMGRQLDEEAARRDAAALAARQSPSSLLPSASSARRGRLFGRSDPNAELLLYAELWSRKIELNQTFELIRAAAKQAHTQPLVTVAVRSDGSIESVNFVRSSGVAEIDEAIRRIVQSQAPYPPFHPALAREFDVIEIRRSWNFDTAIRLY